MSVVPQVFDEGHKRAIRECRFKTVNLARGQAIILDADELRIRATGCSVTRCERAPLAAPGVYEYEARSGDPRVIAYVESLRDR
jgi:hypothetical protein